VDDGFFRSVSVGAVYPPSDKLEYHQPLSSSTPTSAPDLDDPYDTGLSTTARLQPQVPLPLVTTRLVEELGEYERVITTNPGEKRVTTDVNSV